MADRQGYEARRVRLERLAPRPYQGTPAEDAWLAGWDRHLAEAVAARQALPDLTRAEAIAEIRTALRKRTGKAWTVKGGRGSGWSWLTITAPPRRCDESGTMTVEDRDELAAALGIEPHMAHQGVLVPGGGYYWHEYLARARGETPTVYGKPSWD